MDMQKMLQNPQLGRVNGESAINLGILQPTTDKRNLQNEAHHKQFSI
jgi:hypothetical protein